MTAVRPARLADVAACAAILGAWRGATPWMPDLHSEAEDCGFVAGLTTRWRVLRLDGTGIGGFIAQAWPEIPAPFVAGHAPRRGIGSALLGAVRADAARLGSRTFQANAGAIASYGAHGFAEAGRTDGAENEEKLPDLPMEWRRP